MRTKHAFFAEREEREAQFSVQTWTVIGPFVLLLATLKSSMFEDESRNLYEYRVIWYVAEFGLMVTLWYTVYKIAHVWYIRKYNLMYIPKPEILFEEKLPPEYSDTEPKEKSTIACQTESRNHPEEAEKLKTRYNKEIRTINREMRMMKRRYSEKVSKARYQVKTTDAQLSNLQLKVPQLLKEKSSLEDEKEAIEKQLQEERQRHQELRSKFNKLHNQMANPLITGRNYINYH